jgi:hypothetical protein
VNESAARADRHNICPIGRPQLSHDVLDVKLNRLFHDKESLGDIAIPRAFGDVARRPRT